MFDTLVLSQLPPEDEAIRARVKSLIAQTVADLPPHIRARSWMGHNADFSRALGGAGLLGLTLPTRYGGGGLGPFARFVVVEELLSIGAPVAAHWIGDRQSAPLILNSRGNILLHRDE
jgi:alkylation response protein AidB-like acyl-CoA dehydrogenase